MSDTTRRPALGRLRAYATGHRRAVRIASTHSVLNKLFDLAPPVLIGAAVDIVVEQENSLIASFGVTDTRAQVLVLALLTFLIWGMESLFEYLARVAWRNLAQSVQHELRMDAYSQLQQLDLRYFEERKSGDLLAAMNDDVNQLERFLDVGAHDLIQLVTTVIAIGIGFFVIAPSVAWMSFLPIPIILWGSFKYQRMLEPKYEAVREQAAEVNAQLANNLGGIATIKSFTAEEREVARIGDTSREYQEVNRAAIRLSSAFTPLIRIAILLGFTATLVFGGFLALDGVLAVGAYSVMVFLTQRLLWPLTRLGETFDLYQRAMASTARVLDILDERPDLDDGTEAVHRTAGELSFDGVTFGYHDDLPVVRELSMLVEGGSTTAIVGATGAGKSTIVKLLLRFYDPDRGHILLDGVPLPALRMAELRQAIGLVSQDVFLFHGTVRENIAYGMPGASDSEIEAAARVAEAHEFVMQLPDRYETTVGERGQKLSGGQRQRISIARAVLKNPEVLVLDEATSAVDNETEAAIQRSLERIGEHRTVIAIAHRLSTIRNADRIYVLDNGAVAEVGTHEDLLNVNGIYAALWRVQTGVQVQH